MSVIIRLQNLPWSANALDIRTFFQGLSIPEGGVHIVGGELGDAFIAFSTDEDARQAMMLDGGKIKEIQVKLLLSSRSEMHKVIEAARQSVPLLSLAPQAPVSVAPPAPVSVPQLQQTLPMMAPFSNAIGNNPLASFGIPGLGNPQEIPQPAVIEPPAPLISPSDLALHMDEEEKTESKRTSDRDRRRSKSRSRSRDQNRKERKRDRRDRSRSRDRRRRDRSRSRERRDRKRDRKERSSPSRDRSPSRRSRDKRRSPTATNSQEKDSPIRDTPIMQLPFGNSGNMTVPMPIHQMLTGNAMPNGPMGQESPVSRFNDPSVLDTLNKMQELAKKRNPNAFQGEQNGNKMQNANRNPPRGAPTNFRREGRSSRFEDQPRGCCVAIRNAPNHTSYGDVRRFFPFMIDKHGIKMINDNLGRRTGNIFVRFCEPRSKQLALQRKVNELKGATVTVEDLEDETYEAAIDSFLPFREDNEGDDPGLVIADTDMGGIGGVGGIGGGIGGGPIRHDPEPSYTVLKVSDMPHYVKEHDIIKTFSDFSLLSIMLNDDRLTRTKIAYVQFVKAEDARAAYERRDKYMFGRRHPTLMPVLDEEWEAFKNLDKPEQMIQEEIISEPAAPRDPRQRRMQFDSQQPQPLLGGPQSAAPFFVQPQFNAPHQQYPGGPFPGQFPSGFPAAQPPIDPRANNWAVRQPFNNEPEPRNIINNVNNMDAMDDAPLDCVLMKGLPRDATDRTIVNFLKDTGAVPARIHLMLDSNGMPSGDCFCEFRTSLEARQAASKHGTHLEGCRVTVDLVPRSVVEEALEGPKQVDMEPQQPFFDQPRGGFNGRGSFRGRGGFERGGFGNRGGFDQTRGGFDQSRGSFRGRGGPRGGFERGRGRGGAGRGRGGMFENGGPPQRLDDHDPALEDFGAPGCVVSMENVPFRASIDEILQFFAEFELTQDDVIRRYNERGQPTGDARVAFRTPFDAQRAVKTRHMDTIHDRRITLTIL